MSGQIIKNRPVKNTLLINQKAIISGNMVEIWNYEKPIAKFLSKKPPSSGGDFIMSDEEKERMAKNNATESYHNFSRLAVTNFSKPQAKLFTMTLEDTTKFDIRSVKDCNKKLKEFVQRLRRAYGTDFKYICTIEFQDKNGRGAVHYHMIIDIPYVKAKVLNDMWGNGNINIKAIHDAKHCIVYVGKYMRKGLIDPRLAGKKKYHGSENLIKPNEIYNDNLDQVLKKCLDKEKNYENSYFSQFHDCQITYQKYFL